MAMQAAARPVHPHMRGVYEGFKLDDTPHYGSSPRAWGLPLSNAEICCDCRSIPTYVGFTFPLSLWDPLTTVHPHIRGVYYSRGTAAVARNGPSPHTWGLLLGQAQFLAAGRSIPTYVGFTASPPMWPATKPVHPHIRGVYDRATPAVRMMDGPSPHTWGLQLGCPRAVVWLRSIPTYVGFTARPTVGSSASTGPSPHTWGLLQARLQAQLRDRSIPTYVGFTFLR